MPAAVAQQVTSKKREIFLEALKYTCNVTKAAHAAGVSRREFYRIKEEDPEFAEAWQKALEVGSEALEDELMRRAKEGVLKPVFHKGEICGHVREYSDTLGIFLLKGAKPDKYADRKQVSGPDGGAIPVNISINFISNEQEKGS